VTQNTLGAMMYSDEMSDMLNVQKDEPQSSMMKSIDLGGAVSNIDQDDFELTEFYEENTSNKMRSMKYENEDPESFSKKESLRFSENDAVVDETLMQQSAAFTDPSAINRLMNGNTLAGNLLGLSVPNQFEEDDSLINNGVDIFLRYQRNQKVESAPSEATIVSGMTSEFDKKNDREDIGHVTPSEESQNCTFEGKEVSIHENSFRYPILVQKKHRFLHWVTSIFVVLIVASMLLMGSAVERKRAERLEREILLLKSEINEIKSQKEDHNPLNCVQKAYQHILLEMQKFWVSDDLDPSHPESNPMFPPKKVVGLFEFNRSSFNLTEFQSGISKEAKLMKENFSNALLDISEKVFPHNEFVTSIKIGASSMLSQFSFLHCSNKNEMELALDVGIDESKVLSTNVTTPAEKKMDGPELQTYDINPNDFMEEEMMNAFWDVTEPIRNFATWMEKIFAHFPNAETEHDIQSANPSSQSTCNEGNTAGKDQICERRSAENVLT